MMSHRQRIFSVLFIALGLLGESCSDAPRAAAAEQAAGAADAEKVLIPHASWSCGMPDGIAKPESGTLVLEADLKLAQIYDVGKTPYGQRQAIVVQGGPLTGAKFQGTVLSGGLD